MRTKDWLLILLFIGIIVAFYFSTIIGMLLLVLIVFILYIDKNDKEEETKEKAKKSEEKIRSLSRLITNILCADGYMSNEEIEQTLTKMRTYLNEEEHIEFEKEFKKDIEVYQKSHFAKTDGLWGYQTKLYTYEETYAIVELLLSLAILDGGIKQKEWLVITTYFSLKSQDWSYLKIKYRDYLTFISKQKKTQDFNKRAGKDKSNKEQDPQQNRNNQQQGQSSSQQAERKPLKEELKEKYSSILGVSASATMEEIRSAYTVLAKKYHPDTVQDETLKLVLTEKFKEINEAYNSLKGDLQN